MCEDVLAAGQVEDEVDRYKYNRLDIIWLMFTKWSIEQVQQAGKHKI